ncbi:predicted protein [Nematostella vectensis]|uniref:G-protein coupled receptors family 1 profile domain-containing protein n=1 Tax=Nematostella vectensis TaxID=45351 RepID=A7SNJ8_NEMVE|nr:octopamine receptor beta-1R [Nematostella vectensis]XP_032230337.1 octopamine receptor beta-1R [Nematostella vectensis]XP_032230340.1 octopamine receptor beta-1R [Nematostella vectensis]XP_032230341.1 octopamine receptor beta-1R [Nematostella vectensis]XP_032230342.1 octopamine receptor beta-1R [Nematostella vectensis]XP_032230344.1 octopamine receptor beta-1R [Nematostella vectensis]XP_032230347.1 octopamine receptor beta-1R [Nematostella vectensis]XP_048578349.1 octopamine receptor beta|eukprot:XP_001626823.1 predicted protein [Nematostella vectensis]
MDVYPLWSMTSLGVLSLLVITSNIAVCILVLCTRSLRTYTNGFVVSLAFADILIGLALFIQYPLQVESPVALNVMYSVSLLSSVANLCAVTYDRYLAVLQPLRYTPTIAKYFFRILVGVWVTGLVSAVIPLTWFPSTSGVIHQVYQFVMLVAGIIIPYTFIFICYWRIYKQVRICVAKERKLSRLVCDRVELTKCRRISSEAKLAKVFIVISVMFVLSWLPVIYVTAVIAIGKPELMIKALNSSSPFTLALGSLVNPILYSFLKPDFKFAIRKLVQSLFRGDRYYKDVTRKKSSGDISRLEVTMLSQRHSSIVTVSEM